MPGEVRVEFLDKFLLQEWSKIGTSCLGRMVEAKPSGVFKKHGGVVPRDVVSEGGVEGLIVE